MRLIDADALIVEIKTCLWDWEYVNGIKSKTVLNQTITDIGNMPTIDAVPVVRCKDCKHYWKNSKYEDDMDAVAVCLASPSDDAFCSDGERKDE